MSDRKRRTTPESDVPFLDDAERAESAWLLAREKDPSAPAPSSKIASDYAEIEKLLGNLSFDPSDDSLYDEVLRMGASSSLPPQPWWRRAVFRWAVGGAVVAAAAATMLMFFPRATATELAVVIRHDGPTRSNSKEAVVGDQLVVTARSHEAGDLRVFRSDGILVARCPGGPACSALAHDELTIELTLDAPARYQVIFVVGMGDASSNTTMGAYLESARAANAHIVLYPAIDVR